MTSGLSRSLSISQSFSEKQMPQTSVKGEDRAPSIAVQLFIAKVSSVSQEVEEVVLTMPQEIEDLELPGAQNNSKEVDADLLRLLELLFSAAKKKRAASPQKNNERPSLHLKEKVREIVQQALLKGYTKIQFDKSQAVYYFIKQGWTGARDSKEPLPIPAPANVFKQEPTPQKKYEPIVESGSEDSAQTEANQFDIASSSDGHKASENDGGGQEDLLSKSSEKSQLSPDQKDLKTFLNPSQSLNLKQANAQPEAKPQSTLAHEPFFTKIEKQPGEVFNKNDSSQDFKYSNFQSNKTSTTEPELSQHSTSKTIKPKKKLPLEPEKNDFKSKFENEKESFDQKTNALLEKEKAHLHHSVKHTLPLKEGSKLSVVIPPITAPTNLSFLRSGLAPAEIGDFELFKRYMAESSHTHKTEKKKQAQEKSQKKKKGIPLGSLLTLTGLCFMAGARTITACLQYIESNKEWLKRIFMPGHELPSPYMMMWFLMRLNPEMLIRVIEKHFMAITDRQNGRHSCLDHLAITASERGFYLSENIQDGKRLSDFNLIFEIFSWDDATLIANPSQENALWVKNISKNAKRVFFLPLPESIVGCIAEAVFVDGQDEILPGSTTDNITLLSKWSDERLLADTRLKGPFDQKRQKIAKDEHSMLTLIGF